MRNDDNQAFSRRLNEALKLNAKKVKTPADLALQFNLRHAKDPITPQAAYKWLHGTARPTGDKIKTLAEWLNITTHWLQYGTTDEEAKQVKESAISGDEKELLDGLRKLSDQQQELIAALIHQLVLERKGKVKR